MAKVSVIINTYNAAKYVGETLTSVLQQTYTDYEIIIIDDGSTDNTRDVLQPFLGRVQYVWQPNQERSVARNNGIQRAQGELIAFLDSDDIWLPDKLAQQVAALEQFPQAVLAYGPSETVNDALQPISYFGERLLGGDLLGETELRNFSQQLPFGVNDLLPSAVLVRSSALAQSGPFDPIIDMSEDWDLWIRLARVGPFVHTPRVLCKYRAYGWQKEIKRRTSERYIRQTLRLIEKAAHADPTHVTDAIKSKAVAAIYSYSALACYEMGNIERAKTMLTHANAADPTVPQHKRVTDLLENRADTLWRDTQDQTQVLTMLDTVLANLPPDAATRAAYPDSQHILSRVFMADVFARPASAHTQDRLKKLRAAIRLDPRWLRNRGVLSILARSLLGQS